RGHFLVLQLLERLVPQPQRIQRLILHWLVLHRFVLCWFGRVLERLQGVLLAALRGRRGGFGHFRGRRDGLGVRGEAVEESGRHQLGGDAVLDVEGVVAGPLGEGLGGGEEGAGGLVGLAGGGGEVEEAADGPRVVATAPGGGGGVVGGGTASGLGGVVGFERGEPEPLAGGAGEVALGRGLEEAAVERLGLGRAPLLAPHLGQRVERPRGDGLGGVLLHDEAVPVGGGV